MSRSTRRWTREMVDYAREELGIADAHIEFGSKHPRLCGTLPNGKKLKRTISGSSGGFTKARKSQADLRRALRT